MFDLLIFFGFLGAVIIVPQVLRYNERGRLHQTLRLAFERGQPIPPELIAALQSGRRRYAADFDVSPATMAGWQPRPASSPSPSFQADAPVEPPPAMASEPATALLFPSQARRDLRRGVIWLAIGLGLVASGAAFYVGLYDDGGAPETFASFAAFGAIPGFVGLTYLALWALGRDKTKA